MNRDNTIFELIEKEHQRQLKGIELIASENFVSDQVMEAMGSYLTNCAATLWCSGQRCRTSGSIETW